MEEYGALEMPQQETDSTQTPAPHLDTALQAGAIEEFEEEIELHKTYGGD